MSKAQDAQWKSSPIAGNPYIWWNNFIQKLFNETKFKSYFIYQLVNKFKYFSLPSCGRTFTFLETKIKDHDLIDESPVENLNYALIDIHGKAIAEVLYDQEIDNQNEIETQLFKILCYIHAQSLNTSKFLTILKKDPPNLPSDLYNHSNYLIFSQNYTSLKNSVPGAVNSSQLLYAILKYYLSKDIDIQLPQLHHTVQIAQDIKNLINDFLGG